MLDSIGSTADVTVEAAAETHSTLRNTPVNLNEWDRLPNGERDQVPHLVIRLSLGLDQINRKLDRDAQR